MREQTIVIRDAGNGVLLDAAAGDSVVLLQCSHVPSGAGQHAVAIRGVNRGSSLVSVVVTTAAGPLTAQVTADPSGLFTARFPAVVAAEGEMIAIRAANADAGASGEDRAVVALQSDRLIALPAAQRSGIDAARTAYLAGVPDRLIRAATFQLLTIEPLLRIRRARFVVATAKEGYAFNLALVEKRVAPELDRLHAEAVAGKLSHSEFAAARSKLFADAAVKTAEALPDKDVKAFRTTIRNFSSPTVKKKPKDVLRVKRSVAARAPMYAIGPDLVVDSAFDDVRQQIEELLEALTAESDFGGRVGVLFSDRLRFQPAGLVPGEPIYTLSLAPGEEVQLRQTVETKRRVTFESIEDREQERQTELSSTWTTDVSQTLSDSLTLQNSMNVGFDVGLQTPEVPVSAGIGVSNNVSEASTATATFSTAAQSERSQTATARMRAQHKIRLEISDETTSSLSSTRTLRNPNQQRAVTYEFFKMYRRERVTLERHDARLCLRLLVNDPSSIARAGFESGLDKIDPNNPELNPFVRPQGKISSDDFDFEGIKILPGPDRGIMDAVWVPRHSYVQSRKIDLRRETKPTSGSVPADYLLARVTTSLKSFTWADIGVPPEESTELLKFRQLSGSFRWTTPPPTGVTNPSGTLEVDLPWHYLGVPDIVGPETNGIHEATITITAHWEPSAAALNEFEMLSAQRRQQLLDALKPEAIDALRAQAEAEYPGSVLAQAVQQHIAAPPDLTSLQQTFDFDAAIVESVPYWASPIGRATYARLYERLAALPIPLAISDLLVPALTSAQAVVYLPVREGFEDLALQLIGVREKGFRRRAVNDVNKYRGESFPPAAFPLPTHAEVAGPVPPSGTPAGASAWATSWEPPQRQFLVLSQWQELVPTDGVHVEMRLSESTGTDEHRTALLERDRLT